MKKVRERMNFEIEKEYGWKRKEKVDNENIGKNRKLERNNYIGEMKIMGRMKKLKIREIERMEKEELRIKKWKGIIIKNIEKGEKERIKREINEKGIEKRKK